MDGKPLNISASALSTYKECPRCFYEDRKHKRERPRGHFPALPGGMDRVIKDYFDLNRQSESQHAMLSQHAELQGFDLMKDQDTLKAWRQWNAKKALKIEGAGWRVIGAVDEMLYHAELDHYAPLDNKTTGSIGRTQADAEKYHQTQLDVYALMLQKCGFQPADFGVVLLWVPASVQDGAIVQFTVQIFFIKTNPARAQELIDKAVMCLLSDRIPPSGPECEYCKFIAERNDANEEAAVR